MHPKPSNSNQRPPSSASAFPFLPKRVLASNRKCEIMLVEFQHVHGFFKTQVCLSCIFEGAIQPEVAIFHRWLLVFCTQVSSVGASCKYLNDVPSPSVHEISATMHHCCIDTSFENVLPWLSLGFQECQRLQVDSQRVKRRVRITNHRPGRKAAKLLFASAKPLEFLGMSVRLGLKTGNHYRNMLGIKDKSKRNEPIFMFSWLWWLNKQNNTKQKNQNNPHKQPTSKQQKKPTSFDPFLFPLLRQPFRPHFDPRPAWLIEDHRLHRKVTNVLTLQNLEETRRDETRSERFANVLQTRRFGWKANTRDLFYCKTSPKWLWNGFV